MYMTFTADDTKAKIMNFISTTKIGYAMGERNIVDIEFELDTYERSCMYTYIRRFQVCKLFDCWITIDYSSDIGSDVMIWEDKDKALVYANKVFTDMKEHYERLDDDDADLTGNFNVEYDLLSQPKTTTEEEYQFLKALHEDNNIPDINF